MLGDDGAVGNDDNGPVEFTFEVSNNLFSNLAISNKGAEGDADEEGLALGAVGLLVFN